MSTEFSISHELTQSSLPASEAPLVEWALYYAALGWKVIPLHTPIFDGDGWATGCTCEAWKRANVDPDYVCPAQTRGKHPRHGAWESKATTDPGQIRRWWRAWPQANIGIACGPSGVLMVDEDTYKTGYQGNDIELDEETLRVLSGNEGAHIYYRMPAGKMYGNQTGDLPEGIDIRGWGGQVVAPPSMHPSGRRYQWELDYSPEDRAAADMPEALVTALEAAHSTAQRKAVKFTADMPKPDLGGWKLSDKTIQAIGTPASKGRRSEADMSVCVALVYAGASDDEVRAVFQHHPIGKQGKYADSGDQYLAHTIGKARAYAEAHPREAADRETLDRVKAWMQSTEAIETFKAAGYGNPEKVRKLLAVIVEMATEQDRAWIVAPYAELARRSSIAQGGIGAHLAKLFHIGAIDLRPGDKAKATRVKLVCTHLNTVHTPPTVIGVQARANWNLYREYMGDELFIRGHYAYTVTRPLATLPALGDSALAFLATLDSIGSGDLNTISEITGHGYRVTARDGQRLREHGVVDVEVGARNRKTYTIKPEYRQILEENRSKMPTYGVMLQRRTRYLRGLVNRLTRQGKLDRAAEAQAELARLQELWSKVRKRAGIVPFERPETAEAAAKRKRVKALKMAASRAENRHLRGVFGASQQAHEGAWAEYADMRHPAQSGAVR